MHQYGLIGYPLSHSFSPAYFAKKFEQLGIQDCDYTTFPLADIQDFVLLLKKEKNLAGLNVTIPYKEAIIPFLDELNDASQAIQAVNTIQFKNGRLIGHNTDVYGFEQSLLPLLKKQHQEALILGTGGASKAVAYVLKKLGRTFSFVSRQAKEGQLAYHNLTAEVIQQHLLIINTTPLGMYPKIAACPAIPYEAMGASHLCYDLVYNPVETLFLQKAKQEGASIKNGLEMLHLQAERAWEIWQDL